MGLVGYSGRGMYEQVQKATKHKSKKALREAQITQGLQEWEVTTDAAKRRILQKAKEDLEAFDRTLAVVKLL
jgi:formiminotetrahydrofolate cyclodeaminase